MKEDLVFKRFPLTEKFVDRTLTMLREPSLWFSFPEKFIGDDYDANIDAFFKANPDLLNIAEQKDSLYKQRIKDSSKNGICCFSLKLPDVENWSIYDSIPKKETIIVSYKKVVLEDFFAKKGLGNCFSQVEYKDNPLDLEIKNDKVLINGDLIPLETLFSGGDPKSLDKLWEIMLSRISTKFSHEDEVRIILANENKPTANTEDGYTISIPSNAIQEKIFPEDLNEDLRKKLNLLDTES